MRKNESGEFESVVGNRQLLSGFFVVVLLLAVAFAMGYMVGQNSPRSAKAAELAPASSTISLTQADSRPQPAAIVPEGTASGASGETPKTAPPSSQRRSSAVQSPMAIPEEPPPGSYWQVTAVRQVDAEVVARALKNKGLPTSLSQGPSNRVRVLVGPFSDAQQFGKAKTRLENAGFRPIRISR